MKKVCSACKEEKSIDLFNKGNSSYDKKSECKICQYERNKEYKKRPYRIEANKIWCKNKRKRLPQEERHAIYLKAKSRVEKWMSDNPERYKASRKARDARRQKRMKDAGPIHTSSIITLQEYNIKTFQASSYVCEYCREPIIGSYHLEHITPISRNGKNNLENLAIACKECNVPKFMRTLEEYRPDLIDYFTNRFK